MRGEQKSETYGPGDDFVCERDCSASARNELPTGNYSGTIPLVQICTLATEKEHQGGGYCQVAGNAQDPAGHEE